MPVFFNGRLLVTPTVETMVNDDGMANHNSAVGNVLALIGRSDGGAPLEPIVLSSPADARRKLLGGELLEAAQLAFAPSAETNGPSKVVAIRVNPATQSTLEITDASSTNVINVSSTDYGLQTNQIQVRLEAGSLRGMRVSTRLGNTLRSQDNVARDAFTLSYSGAEATATITVEAGIVTLAAGALSTAIDLTEFPRVQDLVDRINTEAGFLASADPASTLSPSLNGLDFVTDQDIKGAPFTVTSNLQAVVDWLNSTGEDLITAERATGAGTVPAPLPWTNLSGGSNGIVTNTEWQACFDALKAEDVQWVVPLTDSESVWHMCDAHVHYMSGAGKRERRAFVGGMPGTSIDDAKGFASALNSDRTAVCYPGIYLYDAAGKLRLRPAYMKAAAVAGGFSGLTPGETMTNKSLRIPGIEIPLSTPAETDELISAGVLCTHKSPHGGYRVVKANTTWLVDARYNRVEVSTGAATDYTARTVREDLQRFIGRRGSAYTLAEVVSAVDTSLSRLAVPEPVGLGILVGSPAYRNIQASIDGDVLSVAFECSPVIPLNYILTTIHTEAWSGSVTAATAA